MTHKTPIEVKHGKYQLKNWEYFIELACYNPSLIIEHIMIASNGYLKNKKTSRKILEINFDKFKCAKSKPGLQFIFTDLIQGELKTFDPKVVDIISERLDAALSKIKNIWVYGHTTLESEESESRKENIYHMRNWELLIDLACHNPDYIKALIFYAIREEKGEKELPFDKMAEEYDKFSDIIGPEFNIIGCARSRDGLETMLLILLRDSLGIEIHSSFLDKILEKLDLYLDDVKHSFVSFF